MFFTLTSATPKMLINKNILCSKLLVACKNLIVPQFALIQTNVSKNLAKFDPEQFIPKNVLSVHNAPLQPENGRMYDKKPFKIMLKKDKKYSWCLCGWSKTQPFCDGTHKNQLLKIKLKPIQFQVAEDKEYWLCNCKQTKHRPFCDGAHKSEAVQEALKYA